MAAYDQIKEAFQDIIAPEIKRLDERIESLRNEMIAEFTRVDSRIDGVNARIDALSAEPKTAIEIRERLAVLEGKGGIA